jgi:transcriptional regulator with XRE-family HTH domain
MARRVLPKEQASVREIGVLADLGGVLKAERLRRGISQDEMGALVGLTRQKVQQLEAGVYGVAVGTALRVLTDLGVRLLAVPSKPAEKADGDATAHALFDRAEELLRQTDLVRCDTVSGAK